MAAEYLSWVPADVDLSKPNAARIYDYMLGGANNFDVDRSFAKELLHTLPDARSLAQENRGFLKRAVTFLAEQGITQYIDLGSGIPTVGNTHEVAQRIQPDSRVVYVDNEPVAVAHSELILQDNPNATVLRADVRDPESVVGHAATRELLDFTEPVAILMFAIMHFVPDEQDPWGLIEVYRDATVSGSYLAITHATSDLRPELEVAIEAYKRTSNPSLQRSREETVALFDGYDLVEPGVVFARDWRPEIEIEHLYPSAIYGGVGRRP